jgi:release factor glutamine methyltransferase
MNRQEAHKLATQTLAQAGIEDAPRESRYVLTHVLGVALIDLINTPDHLLSEVEEKRFHDILTRRANHEPLARIKGSREFWGLNFILNHDTLEPRPDTETLIEAVLEHFPDMNAPLKILDVGTGSGCILLSLLHEYKNAIGFGSDISEGALAAARENAQHLGLQSRVTFACHSWCDGITGDYDIVVTNPPYIYEAHVDVLEEEVRFFDPRVALNGGADGLIGYRMVIPAAQHLLKSPGFFACEVGFDLSDKVIPILSASGFQNIQTRRDLANVERVVLGFKD